MDAIIDEDRAEQLQRLGRLYRVALEVAAKHFGFWRCPRRGHQAMHLARAAVVELTGAPNAFFAESIAMDGWAIGHSRRVAETHRKDLDAIKERIIKRRTVPRAAARRAA